MRRHKQKQSKALGVVTNSTSPTLRQKIDEQLAARACDIPDFSITHCGNYTVTMCGNYSIAQCA